MTHILLIDDERKLTGPLQSAFEREGYQVTVAHDGHAGLSLALVSKPDVIVLDVMMPGLDGWQVCQAIRERSSVPIIMLTALDESVDRIKGLEMGADDYLVKPFNVRELVARVKALFRRIRLTHEELDAQQQSNGQARKPVPLQFGNLSIDERRHEVRLDDHPLRLRPQEYELLLFFARHRGITISRDTIFDRVWEGSEANNNRTVDVHVRWL
ncbi:MAG: response regulator transcription factor, partial [Anaerolineae bacterium]|nr:response regulator transcription factor [Anaerolineae bacterium]